MDLFSALNEELSPHLREEKEAETYQTQNSTENVELRNDEEEKVSEKTDSVKESRSSSSHHKKHKKEKKKKSSKDRKDEKRREHEKIKTPDSKTSKESKRPSLTMIDLFGVPETKPKSKDSKPKKEKFKETKVRSSSPDNEPSIVVKVCQTSLVVLIKLQVLSQMYCFSSGLQTTKRSSF